MFCLAIKEDTSLPSNGNEQGNVIRSVHIILISERSELLSRVFNDQPAIFMAMSDRTYVSKTHAHVSMSI